MIKRKLDDRQVKEIRSMISEGRKYSDIARQYGVSPPTITMYAKKMGMEARSTGTRKIRTSEIVFAVASGDKAVEVARKRGVTPASISHALKRAGFKSKRDKHDVLKLDDGQREVYAELLNGMPLTRHQDAMAIVLGTDKFEDREDEYQYAPVAARKGPWSAEEDRELGKYLNMGFTARELEKRIGRSIKAIHMRTWRLGLSTLDNVLLRKQEGNKVTRKVTEKTRAKHSRAAKKTMRKAENRYRLAEMRRTHPEVHAAANVTRKLKLRGFHVPPEREKEYRDLQKKRFNKNEIRELMGL